MEIVSIHTTEEEAFEEKELMDYEDALRAKENALNANANGCRIDSPRTVSIVPCDKPDTDDQRSYEERKQSITEMYKPRIQEAQNRYDRYQTETQQKASVEHEKNLQEQRTEILAFMSKWQTADGRDIPSNCVETIVRVVRRYLTMKEDAEIYQWMRDRYIL